MECGFLCSCEVTIHCGQEILLLLGRRLLSSPQGRQIYLRKIYVALQHVCESACAANAETVIGVTGGGASGCGCGVGRGTCQCGRCIGVGQGPSIQLAQQRLIEPETIDVETVGIGRLAAHEIG